MCDYSGVNILMKENIKNKGGDAKVQVVFKWCTPVHNCLTTICNKQ